MRIPAARAFAGARIDDPDDRLRLFDSVRRLFEDVCRDDRLVVGHDSAGVDKTKRFGFPVDLTVIAVARDAGLVADNRPPGTRQPIEERGFSDIGPADDRN